MFPFSISGKIKIKDKVLFSAQAIEDEIASTLLVRGVRVDYRAEGGFTFRLSFVNLLGWNLFQGISCGTVHCVDHPKALHISYKLCFLQLLLLVSILLIFCRWLDVTYSSIRVPVKYYLMVWMWLVCGNMFFAIREFRCFVRTCAGESSDRVFFWRK